MPFAFVAHLKCPLCTWSSLASAPSYADAEKRVSSQLIEHLSTAHPRPNSASGRSDVAPLRASTGS